MKIFNGILTVFLYGCETWSPTLKEGCCGVSENKMPRKMFVMKGSNVNGCTHCTDVRDN
jgi:hypothetical protein